ncbi:ribbon-helix-helix protein, CopG family [Scytonema sp. PCC 10023]|uniref:ribbon-helix-helix protein, CopG family n=1 Tax=Scytonema sp. PCC 10023 TaxID=1680591 RepID=UPI0039C7366A
MGNKKEYFDKYVPIRMSKSDAEFLDKIAAEQNRSRADVVRALIGYIREFSLLVI